MPGQPMPGQPMPGQQPMPGEQPEGSPPSGQNDPQDPNRTPGREELEQAQKEMEQAIQELKAQNRDKASDEQDQAIAQLEAMKARIEEILRQLRSEERELHLTMLEARFQEMHKLQLRINADTVRLDARDAAERGEAHFTKSRDLNRQQLQNVLAAERALMILREEGSSVAFPEAVEQLREDMLTVARRLDENQVGEITQAIERDIIEALAEAIEALKKELEKLKDKKKQPPPKQGQPSDPPLVDILAELKMLRSLQLRVNRMTKQFGRMIESEDGEQAFQQDVLEQLQRLSVRQGRIQEATYNLATGKNK
jgi:hypothetical protein